MKLAHRVLLLSVALAVTVWPIALVVLLLSRHAVERNIAAGVTDSTAAVASRLEQIVGRALADAQAIAAQPELRRALADAARLAQRTDVTAGNAITVPGGNVGACREGELADLLEADMALHARHATPPVLDSLWAVDRRGCLLGVAGEPPRVGYLSEGWLRSALEHGASLSVEPEADGTYRVARTVRDAADAPAGVILLRFRREQLPTMLTASASLRGIAVLATGDHLLVTRGQPSSKEPAELLTDIDRGALRKGLGQTVFRTDPSGAEVVASAQPVGAGREESGCGWLVVGESLADAQLLPFWWLQATLLTICLVVMAATMALGRWLSGRVSEPIESTIDSLTGTSQAIAGASYQMASASRELTQASDLVNVAMTALTGSAQTLSRSSTQSGERARSARLTAAQGREAADQGFESMGQMTRDLQRSGVSADEAERLVRQVAEVAERAERLALGGLPAEVPARRELSQEQNAHLQMAHFAGQVQRAAHKVADHLHSSRADATHCRQAASRLSAELAQVSDSLRRLASWCDEAVTEAQSQSQQVGQLNHTVGQLGQATRQAASHATQAADAFLALANETNRLDVALGRLEEVVGDHDDHASG